MSASRLIRTCMKCCSVSRNIHLHSRVLAPIQVQMPALSPTMEEGKLVKWLVNEGDEVEVGDALCEVETDKAVVTMEANEDGVVAKILIQEGTPNVKINVPIAILAEEGEDISNISTSPPAPPEPPQSPEEVSSSTFTSSPLKKITQANSMISPAVRQTLNSYDLKSNQINPTGPKGIILKGDVLKYVKDNNVKVATHITTAPKKEAPVVKLDATEPTQTITTNTTRKSSFENDRSDFEEVPLSGVRKVIAKRLNESKQTIPHAYSSIDCTIDKILKLRKQLKSDGVKLSVNDFVIKAVASALQQLPEVNTVWEGESPKRVGSVDVSVAVATEGGLITPIVKGANTKGLMSIGEEVRTLAEKARLGRLKPDEFQGGTFTISNLGMFGIKEFTAVINPPQVCIMAIGGTRSVLANQVAADLDEINSAALDTTLNNVMTVTLSSDARVVDDKLASEFLSLFKRNMEEPMYLGLL